jgi:hypothetical protein
LPEPSSGSPPVKRCRHDHAELDGDGFCPAGNGYPLGKRCPFVCPLCRLPLEWDGRCEHCHGCLTGERLDWTFPGDSYDCYDDHGKPIGDGVHWVKTDGPRTACTPTENAENAAMVQRILERMPRL